MRGTARVGGPVYERSAFREPDGIAGPYRGDSWCHRDRRAGDLHSPSVDRDDHQRAIAPSVDETVAVDHRERPTAGKAEPSAAAIRDSVEHECGFVARIRVARVRDDACVAQREGTPLSRFTLRRVEWYEQRGPAAAGVDPMDSAIG